jgi:glycosyl transferase-like sugar-binding protein
LLIPRVFHQIWLGIEPFPEKYARYQQTWLEHHPGWQLRTWTEDDLPRDLRRSEPLERLRVPGERSIFLRLEVLWRHGGVYVDTDFECVRSIEPVVQNARFFIGCTKPGHAHDALFGSVPGHPILDEALETFVSREFYGARSSTLTQLRRILDVHHDDVLFLDPWLLHAGKQDRHRAYAVHHRDQHWKNAAVLTRRLREVKDKERRTRAAHEAAQAELAALRDGPATKSRVDEG